MMTTCVRRPPKAKMNHIHGIHRTEDACNDEGTAPRSGMRPYRRPAQTGASTKKPGGCFVRLADLFGSTEDDGHWQERANCLGVSPDLYFPERGASTREAKAVCAGCDVRAECLEYALQHGEKFGIWGGQSERERRSIRRQRTIARRAAANEPTAV